MTTNVNWNEEIKTQLKSIADRVLDVVDKSLIAFFSGDDEAANEVINLEELLDRLEVKLEEYAIDILETHKPEGYDLRFLVSALKINNDLERMSDIAVDICEVTAEFGKLEAEEIPPLLPLMIDRAKHLHKNSLTAMLTEDIGLALQVRGEDVVIDRYAKEINEELGERGMAAPASIPRILQMLVVVRSIERIADLATNIAEDVIFLVEGTIVRHTWG